MCAPTCAPPRRARGVADRLDLTRRRQAPTTSRGRGQAPARSLSRADDVARDDQLHAAILLTPRRRAVGRNRGALAETCRADRA